MIKLTGLALTLISFSALAQSYPNFVCKKGNQTFKLSSRYGEIEVSDKNGKQLQSIDGLEVGISALECTTCPTAYVFSDEGSVVATILHYPYPTPSGKVELKFPNNSKTYHCERTLETKL